MSRNACTDDACCCSLSTAESHSHAIVACRRQPVQYFEFRNVLVRRGSIVFTSPPNVTQQPVSSQIELFRGQRVAVDYQTTATTELSALARCVRLDGTLLD